MYVHYNILYTDIEVWHIAICVDIQLADMKVPDSVPSTLISVPFPIIALSFILRHWSQKDHRTKAPQKQSRVLIALGFSVESQIPSGVIAAWFDCSEERHKIFLRPWAGTWLLARNLLHNTQDSLPSLPWGRAHLRLALPHSTILH